MLSGQRQSPRPERSLDCRPADPRAVEEAFKQFDSYSLVYLLLHRRNPGVPVDRGEPVLTDHIRGSAAESSP